MKNREFGEEDYISVKSQTSFMDGSLQGEPVGLQPVPWSRRGPGEPPAAHEEEERPLHPKQLRQEHGRQRPHLRRKHLLQRYGRQTAGWQFNSLKKAQFDL